MGVTYKATIKIKCWKQHECVGCGGQYRYKFERSVTGEGRNEAAAEKAAEKAVITTVQKDVDQRPCPRCGCIQPDMIAQKKSNTHFWIAIGLLILGLTVAITALVPSVTSLTYSTASLFLFVSALIGLVAHAAVALANPNKNKEANKRTAAALVDRGVMEDLAAEDDDLAEGEPKPVGGLAIPILGLAAVGVALMIAPFLIKTLSGWPIVPDTKPGVVGPGDTVTVWFPDKIEAVKGYWSGSPRATMTVEGAGLVSLPATAKTSNWGNTITGKSVSNSRPDLYADLVIPKDPNLAGKTIEVRVDMSINYPTAVGRGFDNVNGQVSTTKSFKLAGSGAGGTYLMTMWLVLGGVVLFAIGGFGLMVAANSLRKLASPAEVTPIGGKRRDDDEDEAEDEEDDRPRRSRRDDDDDRPRRRRDRDEDDEDDRPRRARRRDEDDEEDRPRRRRDRDDDEEDDRDRRRRRRYDD